MVFQFMSNGLEGQKILKEKLLFGFQTNKQQVNELDMKFTSFQVLSVLVVT